jgi:hypothetical protein
MPSYLGQSLLRPFAGLIVVALASVFTILPPASPAEAVPGSEAAVISDWNATTIATLADAGKGPPEAFLWLASVHTAIHNAVNGITGVYELYASDIPGPSSAYPEAAAAAAAHRVLLSSFPASQARLDGALAASMAKMPDDEARQEGVWFGQMAADHILALRANDRRSASVALDSSLVAGAWRATPPANAAFLAPWYSQIDAWTLDSLAQFRPTPPPPISSFAYARDFNEVKEYGSSNSTARTPAQTETAQFIGGIPVGPLQASLREVASRQRMTISQAARLFAAVDVSIADAIGTSWNGKVYYSFWRPITAIRMADEDGNPGTVADPNWTPFLATPPYPDYPSGLCAVTGAFTRALTRVLGTDRINVSITSPATGTTRRYETAAALRQEAVDARVWSGIHFRFADEAADQIGVKVADWALDHFFRPTN